MSDLYFNKLAFCALSTALLMTGLNEVSRAVFPAKTFTIEGPENRPPPVPPSQRDYHALFAVSDAIAGKAVASKCVACHHFEPGAETRIGPPLYGVLGRDVASVPGYRYASGPGSLSERAGEWTYQTLDVFLENPKKTAPGTAMNFIGVKKPADRINLIAYLRTLTSGEPEPLP
jgi:cytochrome c